MSTSTPELQLVSDALDGLLALLGRRMFRPAEPEAAVIGFLQCIATKDDILALLPLLTALSSKVDAAQAQLNTRLDQLNSRLDHYHVQLDKFSEQLDAIQTKETQIMATEQQETDALNKIDAATTRLAGNVQVIADTQAQTTVVIETISTELDAFIAAAQNAGVSQALIDQATAIGTRADAAAAASDAVAANAAALVPVLQAIASKGAANPVPVQPPPPLTPPTGEPAAPTPGGVPA